MENRGCAAIDPTRAAYDRPDGTDAIAAVDAPSTNVSPFGLRGTVGNVWEWTNTYDINEKDMIVLCGGSWCDPADFLRLDRHLFAKPKDKFDIIGFRCCRPI